MTGVRTRKKLSRNSASVGQWMRGIGLQRLWMGLGVNGLRPKNGLKGLELDAPGTWLMWGLKASGGPAPAGVMRIEARARRPCLLYGCVGVSARRMRRAQWWHVQCAYSEPRFTNLRYTRCNHPSKSGMEDCHCRRAHGGPPLYPLLPCASVPRCPMPMLTKQGWGQD